MIFKINIFNCLGLLGIFFLSNSVNALQVNISLEKDIINNGDRINIFYDLYYPDSYVAQQIKGMSQSVFSLWMDAFNKENKELTPIDYEGNPSQISLGYRKDGHDYYFETCENIHITGVKSIDISLSEKGCTVG